MVSISHRSTRETCLRRGRRRNRICFFLIKSLQDQQKVLRRDDDLACPALGGDPVHQGAFLHGQQGVGRKRVPGAFDRFENMEPGFGGDDAAHLAGFRAKTASSAAASNR